MSVSGKGVPKLPELRVERVRLSDLHLDLSNLRGHGDAEIDLLVRSLTIFGQFKPLFVDRKSMTVKIGNGRLMAMRRMGWTECDCVLLDWDSRAGMEVMDNRLGEFSGWVDRDLGRWFKDKGTDWWGLDEEMQPKAERLAERARRDSGKKCPAAPAEPEAPPSAAKEPRRCPCCGAELVRRERMYLD